VTSYGRISRAGSGLVISHSYLWKEEEERGQTEGRKDRPCAIILAVDHPDPNADGRKQVAVAPITHSPPHDPNVAVEIPVRVKEYLGLDSERSWVILQEVNIIHLAWLRPASDQERSEPS
jgi:hypothetical protein